MELASFKVIVAVFMLSLPLELEQDKLKPQVSVEGIAARTEDVKSIEAIVNADYESTSGGVGVARQWAREFSLYDPHARFFVPNKDDKTGEIAIWEPTPREYAAHQDAHLVKVGFTARELTHKIYRFGNVASVLSSYEGKAQSTGKLLDRGVNIYQVYYAGSRWWISSVSWDAENPVTSIPPELSPTN